jgi:hypothetical protein
MDESDLQNFGTTRKVFLTFIVVLLSTLILGLGTATQIGFIEAPNLLNEQDDISTLDAVPADANLFLRYDVEGIENSNTTSRIYSEEFSYDKFLTSVDKSSESSITDSQRNISDLGEVIVFGKLDLDSIAFQNQYFGTMVETSDSAEDIVVTVSNSTGYTEQTYKEYRILSSNNTDVTVGVLSSSEFYVIGNKEVVEDVIDTAEGDKKAVDTDKIPKTEGDTHVNLVAYNITGTIGSTSLTEDIERFPNSTFVSYSSLDDKVLTQIRIDYESSVNSDSNITLPEIYDKQAALDFKVNETDTGVTISYSANPDEVESNITDLAVPTLVDYEVPTQYENA